MFTLAAVLFAIIMGFFTSLTITLCITYLKLGLASDFLWQWMHIWVIAYPIATVSIVLYRPFVLQVVGKIVVWVRGHQTHS